MKDYKKIKDLNNKLRRANKIREQSLGQTRATMEEWCEGLKITLDKEMEK